MLSTSTYKHKIRYSMQPNYYNPRCSIPCCWKLAIMVYCLEDVMPYSCCLAAVLLNAAWHLVFLAAYRASHRCGALILTFALIVH